jgi:translation initiation factor 2 beta subunit (eIF-2beta)/eIF-5
MNTIGNDIDVKNKYYDIDFLLDRAYISFNIEKKKLKLSNLQHYRQDRKSYIKNMQDICKTINRTPEEVKTYFAKELGSDVSYKENGYMKIDRLTTESEVKTIFIRYITTKVLCKTCKSEKTRTEKNNRITYFYCDGCKSKYAI